MPGQAKGGCRQAPQAVAERHYESNHANLEPTLGFSLEVTTLRDLFLIQSSQADSVWRVLPVGTGRRPRNGRVAYQPLGFDSLALRGHPMFANDP